MISDSLEAILKSVWLASSLKGVITRSYFVDRERIW